jgi:hypothetical protein
MYMRLDTENFPHLYSFLHTQPATFEHQYLDVDKQLQQAAYIYILVDLGRDSSLQVNRNGVKLDKQGLLSECTLRETAIYMSLHLCLEFP